MADVRLPDDLILPIPDSVKEQDLYKALQDHSKDINYAFSTLQDVEAITAGTGLTDTSNTFSVNVDDTTIEIGGSGLQVKDGSIDTTQLAADSVDKTIIDADIAGNGLSQAAGGELDINVDGTTITITTDVLGVSDLGIDTAQIAAKAVTTAKLEDDLVFATFPSTPSAAPDANYEVANKKYVDDNIVAQSNVIFAWSGLDGADSSSVYSGTNKTPDISSQGNNYFFYGVESSSYKTIFNFKFKKIADIDTVTIYARLWSSDNASGNEAYCKVDIGGANNEVKSTTTNSPAWATAADIDISGLTDGTIYDGIVQLKNENVVTPISSYISAITLIGS